MSEALPATERASPGQALAAARAELKLSVADVSQQIKYGVKQIAAIEADDYANLPGTTFVRGMIRSYAKLVQIDPVPLLSELGARNIPAAATVDLGEGVHEPFIEGSAKSNRIYVVLSVAALVAVAVVAYQWWANPLDTGEVVTIKPKAAQNDGAEAVTPSAADPMAVPASAAALPETTPASVPAPAGAGEAKAAQPPVQLAMAAGSVKGGVSGLNRIALDFEELSWVEIKEANGKILLSQLNPAGTRQRIEGMPPFEVIIGNAAKVRLTYNGAPVDLRPYFKVDVARLKLE
jgi:cytoskeleton protein RodZ